MNSRTLLIDGELYLTLETVAEVYEIQVSWLREAYEVGLFGTGVEAAEQTCIAAVQLDRVSSAIRLHHVLGVDLEAIPVMLEEYGHPG